MTPEERMRRVQDLRNHLVARHGLGALLELEEAGYLSASGKDYVRRLQKVAEQSQRLLDQLEPIPPA
jgi:hypothetical protein